MLRLLTPADFRRVRWKNGLGWTTELAVEPSEPIGEFDWRVSIAEVDADCEFSRFPGIDRSLLVLAGQGMELAIGERAPVSLHAGGEPVAFAGELPVHARLLGGPTRDFNVMTRRGAFEHRLEPRTLAEPVVLERPANSGWLIYVDHGRVDLEGHARGIELGECIVAEPAASAEPPIGLRGAASLVLVRLHALARAPS